MKTIIIAGAGSGMLAAADYINPDEIKIVGYATTDRNAWNVYYERGELKWADGIEPIMPLEELSRFSPDTILVAARNSADDTAIRTRLKQLNVQSQIVSMRDAFDLLSVKLAAIRKLSERFRDLELEGAIADIGCGRCDIARHINAANPERKLYLFDTFTGYDEFDIAKEKESQYSDCQVGDGALSEQELGRLDEFILHSMPYKERVKLKKGWFPDTVVDIKKEKFVLVNVENGLYAPTYNAIKYFFPRMVRGGVIMLAHYEDPTRAGVSAAVRDIEKELWPMLITPLCDADGTVLLIRP